MFTMNRRGRKRKKQRAFDTKTLVDANTLRHIHEDTLSLPDGAFYGYDRWCLDLQALSHPTLLTRLKSCPHEKQGAHAVSFELSQHLPYIIFFSDISDMLFSLNC